MSNEQWVTDIECSGPCDFQSILTGPVQDFQSILSRPVDGFDNPALIDSVWDSDDESRQFFDKLKTESGIRYTTRTQDKPPFKCVGNGGPPRYNHRPITTFEEYLKNYEQHDFNDDVNDADNEDAENTPSSLKKFSKEGMLPGKQHSLPKNKKSSGSHTSSLSPAMRRKLSPFHSNAVWKPPVREPHRASSRRGKNSSSEDCKGTFIPYHFPPEEITNDLTPKRRLYRSDTHVNKLKQLTSSKTPNSFNTSLLSIDSPPKLTKTTTATKATINAKKNAKKTTTATKERKLPRVALLALSRAGGRGGRSIESRSQPHSSITGVGVKSTRKTANTSTKLPRRAVPEKRIVPTVTSSNQPNRLIRSHSQKRMTTRSKSTVTQPLSTLARSKSTVTQPLSTLARSKSTVTQPRSTLVRSKSAVTQPLSTLARSKSTVTQPLSTLAQSKSTGTQPPTTLARSKSTVTQPRSTLARSKSAVTQPLSTIARSKSTVTQPRSTLARSKSTVTQPLSTLAQSKSTGTQPPTTLARSKSTVTQPLSTLVRSKSTVTQPLSTFARSKSAVTQPLWTFARSKSFVERGPSKMNRTENEMHRSAMTGKLFANLPAGKRQRMQRTKSDHHPSTKLQDGYSSITNQPNQQLQDSNDDVDDDDSMLMSILHAGNSRVLETRDKSKNERDKTKDREIKEAMKLFHKETAVDTKQVPVSFTGSQVQPRQLKGNAAQRSGSITMTRNPRKKVVTKEKDVKSLFRSTVSNPQNNVMRKGIASKGLTASRSSSKSGLPSLKRFMTSERPRHGVKPARKVSDQELDSVLSKHKETVLGKREEGIKR